MSRDPLGLMCINTAEPDPASAMVALARQMPPSWADAIGLASCHCWFASSVNGIRRTLPVSDTQTTPGVVLDRGLARGPLVSTSRAPTVNERISPLSSRS